MGVERLAAHLTTLPFLAILLTSTYYLAKKLVTPVSAFLAALLVASVPIVLHETSQIYLDLPTAALTTLSLTLLFNQKQLLAAVVLALAALTKETALSILPLFSYIGIFGQALKTWRHKATVMALVALPLVAYLSYVLIFHQFTGFWFSTRDGRLSDKFTSSASTLLASVQDVGESFFIENGMWFLSVVAFIAISIIWRKRSSIIINEKHLLGFLLTVFTTLTAYALFQEYTLRYSLMILPLWIVSVVKILESAGKVISQKHSQAVTVAISTIALVILGFHWYPKTEVTNSYSFSPPTNLTVLDRIFVFRQAAKYLELTHQGKEILGSFPENQQLTQPYLGYVDKILPFSLCNAQVSQDSSHNRLLVFHPYSPVQMECKKLLETNQATLLNRFERNGSWVEVFELEGQKLPTPDLTN